MSPGIEEGFVVPVLWFCGRPSRYRLGSKKSFVVPQQLLRVCGRRQLRCRTGSKNGSVPHSYFEGHSVLVSLRTPPMDPHCPMGQLKLRGSKLIQLGSLQLQLRCLKRHQHGYGLNRRNGDGLNHPSCQHRCWLWGRELDLTNRADPVPHVIPYCIGSQNGHKYLDVAQLASSILSSPRFQYRWTAAPSMRREKLSLSRLCGCVVIRHAQS